MKKIIIVFSVLFISCRKPYIIEEKSLVISNPYLAEYSYSVLGIGNNVTIVDSANKYKIGDDIRK